jgi:uncharacterized protein with FMN-binding domain
MRKGRGKGKISQDLVAAGCVAVLAVYAAGYSRTREAARRFETHAKERRASPRAERPAVDPQPAASAAPAPHSAPEPETTTANALVAPKRGPRKSAASKAVTSIPRAALAAAAATARDPTAGSAAASPDAPRAIEPTALPPVDTTKPQPIAITRGPAPATAPSWRDGTYTGLGESFHGDIEARVVIRDGRIVEAGIATCDTRYPCDVIDPLIHQPVERQSPNVDYMSHATESSDAYYDALVAALEKAVDAPPGEAAPK